MFVLRMDDAHEAFVVLDIFQPMYASIWEHHVLPYISAASTISGTAEDRLHATLNTPAAFSLPDNAEVMALSSIFSLSVITSLVAMPYTLCTDSGALRGGAGLRRVPALRQSRLTAGGLHS
jgi:hypothetical protein